MYTWVDHAQLDKRLCCLLQTIFVQTAFKPLHDAQIVVIYPTDEHVKRHIKRMQGK